MRMPPRTKYAGHNSSVAQLVERLTVNQLVPGSSPGRGAKQQKAPFYGGFFYVLEPLLAMSAFTESGRSLQRFLSSFIISGNILGSPVGLLWIAQPPGTR